MRILTVNQYAGGPNLGMEYRPHWLSSNWAQSGNDVLVVAGDCSHLRLRPVAPGRASVDGLPFVFLRTLPYVRNGPRRFMNILSFRAQLWLNSDRFAMWRPDVVIASSTHPMDVRPAMRIARLSGAALVYEVHDLWPLTPMLLGGHSAKHPVILAMQREEDFGYRNADLVVSLLPNTEQYMRRHGLPPNKWTWSPNGVPESPSLEPAPAAQIEGMRALRNRYRRVIIYAGTLGLANAMDHLLEKSRLAASLGIGLAILGDGPAKPALMDRYRTEPNVTWLDPVSRAQVPSLLAAADIGYAGASPSPLYEFGVSFNKIADYLAVGLPTIENIGAANSLVSDAAAGWSITPSEPSQLDAVLRSIASISDTELAAFGEAGQTYVERHLRQDLIAKELVDAFKSIQRSEC